MGRIIIGLTGAFGCGATFLAEKFFRDEEGFTLCSLSTVLKRKYFEEYKKSMMTAESCKNTGISFALMTAWYWHSWWMRKRSAKIQAVIL